MSIPGSNREPNSGKRRPLCIFFTPSCQEFGCRRWTGYFLHQDAHMKAPEFGATSLKCKSCLPCEHWVCPTWVGEQDYTCPHGSICHIHLQRNTSGYQPMTNKSPEQRNLPTFKYFLATSVREEGNLKQKQQHPHLNITLVFPCLVLTRQLLIPAKTTLSAGSGGPGSLVSLPISTIAQTAQMAPLFLQNISCERNIKNYPRGIQTSAGGHGREGLAPIPQ